MWSYVNTIKQLQLLGLKPEAEAPTRSHVTQPVSRGANSMDLIYDFSAIAE